MTVQSKGNEPMNDIEKYNIIECIIEDELFEIIRKMELIKVLLGVVR